MLANKNLSLKGRALRYLAAREHSRLELTQKLTARLSLQERQAQAQALEQVLDELTAKGFISEVRVADVTLHRQAPKYGALRVLDALRKKGLSQAQLDLAAADLLATETDRAKVVWEKKFGQKPKTPREYAQQARFLASRGFAAQTVAGLLR